MMRFIKISAILTLTASAAFAQAGFDVVFDGRAGLAPDAWRPDSVLPVIRETRESNPAQQPTLPPVRTAVEPSGEVSVALQVLIPAASQQPQALAQRISRLAIDYGFAPDPSFEPVRVPEFQILPFPPLPQTRNTYLIRGALPAGRVQDLQRDPSVRKVWHERSASEKGVEELLLRHRGALRKIAGIRRVYIGLDCGLKEEHAHVLPHHTALVIELDGTVAAAAVRQAVFLELPELAVEPVLFEEAAVAGSRR